VQLLWKAVWKLLKTLKVELPYDPAIPLLDIYPKEYAHRIATCRSMFIEALLTIVTI
jgi:hypothetical protein